MRLKAPPEEYLEKAKLLSSEDAERLMARMHGRFKRRTEDKNRTDLEALAFQLQYEDEELAEWRARIAEIREKHED